MASSNIGKGAIVVLSVFLQLQYGNAFEEPVCSDQRAGLLLDDLPSVVVALSYAKKPLTADKPNSTHIGNAVLVKKREDGLLFLTAHHVVHRACEVVEKQPGTTLILQYQIGGKNHTSKGFTLDQDRCERISAEGFRKSIDVGFFQTPVSAVATWRILREAPILDRANQSIAYSQYYGYKPFPVTHSERSTLSSTADPNAYAIARFSDRGWSGTPVFRLVEGDKSQFFLSGVIFSSPALKEVYDQLSEKEGPTSDKRVGAVLESVLQKTISDKRTLVVRLARYQFHEWQEERSEAVQQLDMFIGKNEKMTKDDIYSAIEYLEGLSSGEQFEVTSYLLKRIRVENEAKYWSRHFLLALAMSVRNWCYYNKDLESRVVDLVLQENQAYTRNESTQVIKFVELVQHELKSTYTNKEDLDKRYVYENANNIFSLIYKDQESFELREELFDLNLPRAFWSTAIYDHARANQQGLGNTIRFETLVERSLEMDPSNWLATWALADHLNAENLDIGRALGLYNDLLEEALNQDIGLSSGQLRIIENSRSWAITKQEGWL